MDIQEIIQAWKTSFNPSDLEELKAEARRKVCEECESCSKGLIPICKECGCPIAGKVYASNVHSCKKDKWWEADNLAVQFNLENQKNREII